MLKHKRKNFRLSDTFCPLSRKLASRKRKVTAASTEVIPEAPSTVNPETRANDLPELPPHKKPHIIDDSGFEDNSFDGILPLEPFSPQPKGTLPSPFSSQVSIPSPYTTTPPEQISSQISICSQISPICGFRHDHRNCWCIL